MAKVTFFSSCPTQSNKPSSPENTSNSVFSSALSNPEYKLLNSALYKTSLFIENGLGCTQELTETKTLSPYTNRELLGSDRILYISNTLDLKVENYSQYLWNDNSTSNFKNLKGIDLGLGKTIVGLVVMDRDGCQFSDSIEIDVQCSPNTLDIGGNQTVDKWDNITLSANSNYASYLWNDNTTKKSIDIKAHLLGAGVYNYSLKATDQYNCAYTDNMTLTVTDLVSIDDASKRTIKVYPTPTKDILQIDLPQSFKGGKLEIINLIGKVVLQKEIEGAKIGTYKLNIAHLPKGAYILKLSTSEGEFNFKIVKE